MTRNEINLAMFMLEYGYLHFFLELETAGYNKMFNSCNWSSVVRLVSQVSAKLEAECSTNCREKI